MRTARQLSACLGLNSARSEARVLSLTHWGVFRNAHNGGIKRSSGTGSSDTAFLAMWHRSGAGGFHH